MASTNSTQNASPPSPSTTQSPPPPKDSAPPPKQSPPPPPPPKEDQSPPPASPPPPSPKQESPPPPSPKQESPPPPPPSPPTPESNPPPKPPTAKDPPPAPASESRSPPQPKPPEIPSSPPTKFPLPPVPPVGRGSQPSLNPPRSTSLEPTTTTTTTTTPTGDSANHNGGIGSTEIIVIAGVTGAFLLLLVAALLCVICMKNREKKQKRPPGKMQYYGDPSRGRKGSGYYENQSWYGPPSKEHGPPQTPPGYKGPPGGGWAPTPIQPPSSGEMSSNLSDPHHAPNPASPNLAFGFNKSSFTYDELAAATVNFSQANLLGQGGFGYVHKGVLPNGKVVAVKSLKSGSGQGEREFQAEVDIISRVHHRHLVSLVGYCIAGAQRMLVYEFVPNGNLEQHLHANYKGVTLDWSNRLNIGIGSAKGLAYLHEDCHPRIIHRDIKAANILLDDNYEAMVADFGLAKLTTDNLTHVSTRVMGTFGYMAPEYASSGKLTEKSDVFSFGVMLLELITGRRPVDTSNKYMEDSLVDWARPIMTRALSDGNFDELVDPKLENKYNHNEMRQMIACASASIRHSAKRRPKMSQIVRALEGDVSLDDLNDATRANQSSSSSTLSSEYDTRAYNDDLKKFRKMALESQIEGDDYNVNPSSGSEETCSREMKNEHKG